MKIYAFLYLILFFCFDLNVSSQNFNRQDSLRGSITKERAWWDLTYYDLEINIIPKSKKIYGKNTIHYKILEQNNIMQIDLQPPMKLTRAFQHENPLNIKKDGNAHFIKLLERQNKNNLDSITLYFSGRPREALNAPWDGGFSWEKDTDGNDFVATSCQGIGASLWWPNKDHMYDEVDSMRIRVEVPKKLKAISNGRLINIDNNESSKSYTWFVSNPINNYGVNVNIGNYVNFSDVFEGENGLLDLDFYVLKHNLNKAKVHFSQVKKMMKAFEHWFGPYPFYEDSYKLVEVPYLGMEHQSSVTYGNNYKNGYLGRDLSSSGWGLKFDFIIIHESAHEWFANNITNIDAADMWIHEGFATYAENLFLDYYYGKNASSEYVIGLRKNIKNDKPIIGQYGVNNKGSNDMYYKAANMIHILRQLFNNDQKWRTTLRKMNNVFFHKTVTTEQIENFISDEIGWNLKNIFDQYLRDTRIPIFEYKTDDKNLYYRWNNVVDGFEMPLEIIDGNVTKWVYPTELWQLTSINNSNINIDADYYVYSKKIN